MIVVSDNFDFVIDDQYITISILLKYKPGKRYPFYAGLKIKQTFLKCLYWCLFVFVILWC